MGSTLGEGQLLPPAHSFAMLRQDRLAPLAALGSRSGGAYAQESGCRRSVELTLQQERLHLALAFDLQRTPFFEPVFVSQQFVGGLGDLDLPGDSVRLHAARGIHGVPPDIIGKLLDPNHSGNRCTGVNADSNL